MSPRRRVTWPRSQGRGRRDCKSSKSHIPAPPSWHTHLKNQLEGLPRSHSAALCHISQNARVSSDSRRKTRSLGRGGHSSLPTEEAGRPGGEMSRLSPSHPAVLSPPTFYSQPEGAPRRQHLGSPGRSQTFRHPGL